jgi:hypothetical protein
MPVVISRLTKQFNDQGFCLIPSHVPTAGLREIFADIDRVFERALTTIGQGGQKWPLDQKYLGLAKLNSTLKSRCYELLGRLQTLHRYILTEEVQQIGESLFHSALLLDGMMIRIGEPANDRLLPMHQDFGHLSKLNLNVWTALTPSNETRGGLTIVPGSHKLGRVPHRYEESPLGQRYHGVSEKSLEGKQVVTLSMNAGDTLVFHPYLIHGSTPNPSPELRWTAICRLNELSEISYLSDPEAPLHWPQHSKDLFGDEDGIGS